MYINHISLTENIPILFRFPYDHIVWQVLLLSCLLQEHHLFSDNLLYYKIFYVLFPFFSYLKLIILNDPEDSQHVALLIPRVIQNQIPEYSFYLFFNFYFPLISAVIVPAFPISNVLYVSILLYHPLSH